MKVSRSGGQEFSDSESWPRTECSPDLPRVSSSRRQRSSTSFDSPVPVDGGDVSCRRGEDVVADSSSRADLLPAGPVGTPLPRPVGQETETGDSEGSEDLSPVCPRPLCWVSGTTPVSCTGSTHYSVSLIKVEELVPVKPERPSAD